jgi:hypothetical protein
MARSSYNYSVFINCPIDDDYTPLFRAAVFAVLRCGFNARCALEEDDSGEIRLNKIFRIISECRLGIHDLSRTRLDRRTRLPRFNMPFELGIFMAAKYFGREEHDRKVCKVFEARRHTYEMFISDIKGQDITAHNKSPQTMIITVRDWLAANSPNRTQLQGGQAIWRDYQSFLRWMPQQCHRVKLRVAGLTFGDYWNLVYKWIEDHE